MSQAAQRGFLLGTGVLAIAGLGTCGRSSHLEVVGLGYVIDAGRARDAGDAQQSDGGGDAGVRGWRVVLRHVLPPETFSANLRALSSSGALAGDGVETRGGPQFAWIADVETGVTQKWTIEWMGVGSIRALLSDGQYCGSSMWPYPPFPGSAVGTAVMGRDGGVERMLPDPLTSSCRDMNELGVAIGEWGDQAFLRWADGGAFRFDFYRYPEDGGVLPGRPIYVKLSAINERNEVVGLMRYGYFFGAGNPAALYWSPDAGPRLLRNTQGLEVANDINNRGVIVGQAFGPPGSAVATIWSNADAEPVYLASPPGLYTTQAQAINDDGLVVGYGMDEVDSTSHGVLWWKGKAYLANDVVRGLTSNRVESLDFVNNSGRIAGSLIEMIPEPDGGGDRPSRQPIVIDVLEYPSE